VIHREICFNETYISNICDGMYTNIMIERFDYLSVFQRTMVWKKVSSVMVILLILSSPLFVLSSYAENDETTYDDDHSGDTNNDEKIMDPHTFIQMYAGSKQRVLPDKPVSNEGFQPDKESNNHHNFDDSGFHQSSEYPWSGIPEAIEAETNTMGIEIHLDYVVSIDDEKSIISNPEVVYNGGIQLMAQDTMVMNFLTGCHYPCSQPNEIRSVYLVSSLTNDNDIVGGNIKEKDKIAFEQIAGEINKFQLPPRDALLDDDLYKMVVHTGPTDEIDAYYIAEDVEII
jgi:hypothetical protein